MFATSAKSSRRPAHRKARIQHLQPWLVEPLDLGGGEDGAGGNEVPAGSADATALPPLVCQWLDTLQTAGTRRAYGGDARGFLAHAAVGDDVGLLGVRRPLVVAWRNFLAFELEHGRLTYQSCKRRMAAVSSLYDFLNQQGHVIDNPVRRVRRPRRPEAEKQKEQRRLAEKARQLVEHKCPLTHCPAVGSYVGENRVPALPDVTALLAEIELRRGQQLTLW